MKYISLHSKWRLPYVLGASLTTVAMLGQSALLPVVYADAPPRNDAAKPDLLTAKLPSAGGHITSGATADDSHVSLTLRDAPVTHMLSLLSSMTKINFRYATPPDGKITASFNDVPLVPTLAAWLGATGFDLRRSGSDFFVFRDVARQPFLPGTIVAPDETKSASRSLGNSSTIPPSWHYWNLPAPPPPGWKMPGATDTVEFGARGRSDDGWHPAVHRIMPELRPGIAVAIPSRNGPAAPAYLRCLMPLKFVPRGAQLVVETPAEATLYVNGAPLLRRWKGRRIVDLSRVLAPGYNCLAIQWSPPARDKTIATASPLLRYEWFFAGDTG